MSTLTAVDFIRDMKRIKEELGPPSPTEIKVGSALRFREALDEIGAKWSTDPAPFGSLAGLPVRICRWLPENMIVLMNGDRVEKIITLGEDA